MKSINKRLEGNKREDIACNFLQNQGLKILCRNYYVRQGEIDIIAKDEDCLVFIEVKYRRNASVGNPLEAITINKQKKICKTALFYLNENKINPYVSKIRFDVMGIENNDVKYIKNAFDYI